MGEGWGYNGEGGAVLSTGKRSVDPGDMRKGPLPRPTATSVASSPRPLGRRSGERGSCPATEVSTLGPSQEWGPSVRGETPAGVGTRGTGALTGSTAH